jgi:hypothetical protein
VFLTAHPDLDAWMGRSTASRVTSRSLRHPAHRCAEPLGQPGTGPASQRQPDRLQQPAQQRGVPPVADREPLDLSTNVRRAHSTRWQTGPATVLRHVRVAVSARVGCIAVTSGRWPLPRSMGTRRGSGCRWRYDLHDTAHPCDLLDHHRRPRAAIGPGSA